MSPRNLLSGVPARAIRRARFLEVCRCGGVLSVDVKMVPGHSEVGMRAAIRWHAEHAAHGPLLPGSWCEYELMDGTRLRQEV